jgi:CheY-like chemotaxis protein
MTEHGTILLVDDDRELRRGLKTVLNQHGYRTLEADDGVEASALIEQHHPDLVILDMMMPRWNGLAVLERYSGQSDAPPFIMITANDGPRHKGYAEKLGVIDYIQKPFSVNRLLERVSQIVPTGSSPAPTQSSAEIPVPSELQGASIRCRCSGCGSRIKAPMALLGQTRPCPRCKQAIVVTIQPPEDEGPKLVLDDGHPTAKAPRPAAWR